MTDATGAAVAKARVEVRLGAALPAPPVSTGQDGRFAFTGLPLGRWRVTVTQPGFVTESRDVELRTAEALDLTFALRPGPVAETVTVTEQVRSYQEPVASSMGLALDIREIPAVINTVSAEFLEDTATRRLRDVLNYIPGVVGTETNGATGDQALIRGFANNTRKTLNGMRLNAIAGDQTQNPANIERIEVLKGPASVQFGVDEPGGSINFITKRPQSAPFHEVLGEFGSYGYAGGELDTTASLAGSERLFYRFIVAGNKAGSVRDTLTTDRLLFAPSLQVRYGRGSSVLLEVENHNMDQPYDRGTFYLEGAGYRNGFAPIHWSSHEPSDYLRSNYTRGSLYWTHELGSRAELRATGMYLRNTRDSQGARNPNLNGLYARGTNRYSGNPTVTRTYTEFAGGSDASVVRPEATVRWRTGGIRHTSLAGASSWTLRGSQDGRDGFDTWNLNAFSPVHGRAPVPVPFPNSNDRRVLPPGARDFISRSQEDEYGVFYQHKADVLERLHVLGGVRFDYYRNRQAYADNRLQTPTPPFDGFVDRITSWRLGATYEVAGPLSVFGGFSSSFVPQSGRDRQGGRFDPLAAKSWEGGGRLSFFSNQLRVTASAFDIEQSNITQPDPDNLPGESFLLPLGTTRVRGAEVEAVGSLTPWWDVVAGGAHLHSRITRNLSGLEGNKFFNVPELQGSVWNRFDLSARGVPGLSLALGLVYTDARFGNNQNNFVLPSFFRTDVGAFYRVRRMEFRVAVQNLLNETYYIGSQNRPQNIAPGAPRLVNGGVRYVF